jgi:hypothetical protein
MIVRYNFNGEVAERGPMVVFVSDGCINPMRVTFDVHLNVYVECRNGVFNAIRYRVYHFGGIKRGHVVCSRYELVQIGDTGTWGWLKNVYDAYRPLVFMGRVGVDEFVRLCEAVRGRLLEESMKVYEKAYGVGYNYEARGELLHVINELMKREDMFIVV